MVVIEGSGIRGSSRGSKFFGLFVLDSSFDEIFNLCKAAGRALYGTASNACVLDRASTCLLYTSDAADE